MKNRASFVLILCVFLLKIDAYAQICGLCKLSLMNSPEGRHIAAAFNRGILFLLAMPYLVGASLFLIFYLLYRRRSKMENLPD